MLYGGSRRFWDIAHEYCKNGIGSHLEPFLPTVVKSHDNMKAVGLQVPTHPALPRTLFQPTAALFPSSQTINKLTVDLQCFCLPGLCLLQPVWLVRLTWHEGLMHCWASRCRELVLLQLGRGRGLLRLSQSNGVLQKPADPPCQEWRGVLALSQGALVLRWPGVRPWRLKHSCT